jgi:hypothetical protein
MNLGLLRGGLELLLRVVRGVPLQVTNDSSDEYHQPHCQSAIYGPTHDWQESMPPRE